MKLSSDEIEGFNLALDEATVLGAELNDDRTKMAITFDVLTLPSDTEPEPEDSRISLRLHDISRLAVSLRKGRWDDDNAEILRFEVSDFFNMVHNSCGGAIYGIKFLNAGEEWFETWKNKLSLNFVNEDRPSKFTLDLFQDGQNTLNMRVWFESFKILSPELQEIELETFISGGKRWWEGFNRGDMRTMGRGMIQLDPDKKKDRTE